MKTSNNLIIFDSFEKKKTTAIFIFPFPKQYSKGYRENRQKAES